MLRGRSKITVAGAAAEAQGEADAGVDGVVGGGGAVQIRGEDLRAVLNGAVEEHPLRIGVRRGGLLHAEGAIEIANLEHGVAGVGGVKHDGEDKQEHAGSGPEQPLRPAVLPGDRNGERGGDEECDGEVVVGGKNQRAGDADEKGSRSSAGSDEEIEESGLRRALRAQGVGLGVAEEPGEEAFDEEEEDRDADGEADVGLRDRVAEAGQHHNQKTHDDTAAIERGKLEGDDEGEKVDG
jgi:hypothetical protein